MRTWPPGRVQMATLGTQRKDGVKGKQTEKKKQKLRDWSLITGRGGLQNGKIAGPKLFAPPPQDRVKLFVPPLLKSGNFTRPPYNMA